MPHRLKIRAPDTDAGAMSETALTPPNDTTPTAAEGLVTDDGAPRLGSTPITPPAPMGGAGVSVFDDTSAAPTLPVVSPVLSDPSTPMQPGAEYSAPADPAAAAPSIPTPTIPAPVLPTAAPVAPAAPPAPAAPAAAAPTAAPSPVFDAGTPSIPAPSLPTAAPTPPPAPATETAATTAGDGEHPMAHMMGDTATKPSEASKRAAQLRAEKKAKAKKMKISFAIGAVVVSAVAGPPLWSWFTNALDEAGTSTEQPAD